MLVQLIISYNKTELFCTVKQFYDCKNVINEMYTLICILVKIKC